MQKILQYDKGDIIIGYCTQDDLMMYQSGYMITPAVTIQFKPTKVMNEGECLDYLKTLKEEVIDITKSLLSDNINFYKHFELNFGSEFMCGNPIRNPVNP